MNNFMLKCGNRNISKEMKIIQYMQYDIIRNILIAGFVVITHRMTIAK